MSHINLHPYADLQTFNSLVNTLIEIVNVHLNDPYNDSESLKVLQSMVGKVIEASNELAKRKLDRAVAEQIVKNLYVPSAAPYYYAMPELPSPTAASTTSGGKRKASSLEENSKLNCVSVDEATGEGSSSSSSSSSSAMENPTIPAAKLSMTTELASQLSNQVVNPVPHALHPSGIEWLGKTTIDEEGIWTSFNVRRLRSVVSQLGENWLNVAVYMNCGLTAKQCSDKWHEIKHNPDIGRVSEAEALMMAAVVTENTYQPFRGTTTQYKEWCTYEIIYLKELVVKHQQKIQGRLCINWQLVSQSLNRPEQDCRERWQHICATRVKKGPYKQEEDEVILQRMTEYTAGGGDLEAIGNDIWEWLEKELGRPAKNIRMRWKASLFKKLDKYQSVIAGGGGGGGRGSGSSSSSSGGGGTQAYYSDEEDDTAA